MRKPFNQLTDAELADILFYTASNGVIIPVSKIEAITDTTLKLASGETYTINAAVAANLTAKLAIYEAYQLENSATDFEAKLKAAKEDTFKADVEQIFQNLYNSATTATEKFHTHLGNILQAAEDQVSELKATASKAKSTVDDIKQTIRAEDFAKLKEELTKDITDIKPIKVNLQDVTNLLKQLFNDANNKPTA